MEKKLIKKQVLIVEDEAIVAEDLAQTIISFNYDVPAILDNGAEAVQYVKANKIDLILMDVLLQGDMSGTDAALQISRQSTIPIIFITAYADEATLEESAACQPAGYILKPYRERELRAAIEMAFLKKEMEQKLKSSEQRYRHLVESLNDGLITINENGEILYANSAAAGLFKQAPAKLIHQTIDKCLSPKGSETLAAAIRKLSVKEPVIRFHLETESEVESIRFLQISVHRFQENNGILTYHLLLQDLTQMRQAEMQIRSSEERHRRLIETMRDSLVIVKDNRILYHNPQFCGITGYGPERLKELPFTQLFVEDSQNKLMEIWDQEKEGIPLPVAISAYLADKSQKNIPVEISARQIRYQGDWAHFYLLQDVSDKKDLETEREQFLMAMDQVGESIIITNEFSEIEYVNEAFTAVTGYSKEEVLGKTPAILKSGQMSHAFYQLMWHKLLQGKSWSGRIINRRKDGQHITEDITITPVKDQNQKTIKYIAVKRDISKELMQQRAQQQKQKMESLGLLAGGVAHDFNNILSGIIGSLLVLKEKAGDDSSNASHIDEALKAAGRAGDLVKQILHFSRSSDQKLRPVEIRLLISDAVKILRSTIPVSVKFKTDIKSAAIVNCDPIEIHQIVMNLCTNSYHAVRYRPDPTIHVSLRDCPFESLPENIREQLADGNYVELTIHDNGKGISAHELDRIFEPYFTTKKAGEGTGLGLSIVHGIVLSYHGHISVESEPGSGATFKIFLPADEKATAMQAMNKQEAPQTGGGNLLFIDDELTIVSTNRILLEKRGFQVAGFTDPESALERFTENPQNYSVVLTDMTMPAMNGLELTQKIRAIRPDIPVIICTGYSDLINDENYREFGVDAILYKPVQLNDMVRIISEMMKN
jgi:two-component system, cell cycle sensor histidine kinase and response regulator CckA